MGTRSFKSKWKIIWKKKGLLVKDDKTRQQKSHKNNCGGTENFHFPLLEGIK